MTDMITVTEPSDPSTVNANPVVVIAAAVVGALVFNLMIYVVGRACGGTFTYVQNGKSSRVNASAVVIMSVVPATIGLAVVAWLSHRWPILISAAKVVAPVLALATIGVMTLPAHFDTTSTLSLAAMHIALVPAVLLALGALTPRRLPTSE